MSAALHVGSGRTSRWALPHMSARFVPVWRRNFLVWRKLFLERLLTNVIEPLLTIVAFGYGLGSLLPQIEGVSYLQFLASGAIAMSVIYSAKFESLWGAFSRMHVQKTWDAILHTPLAVDDLLLGGIPFGSNVLIHGPPFIGKEVMMGQFIGDGLKKGVPCIMVITDKTPKDLRDEMRNIVSGYEIRRHDQIPTIR